MSLIYPDAFRLRRFFGSELILLLRIPKDAVEQIGLLVLEQVLGPCWVSVFLHAIVLRHSALVLVAVLYPGSAVRVSREGH